MNNHMIFNAIPVGSVFRAMRNDVIAGRIVKNDSIYFKVGHNVSVDMSCNNKDCIFNLDMPCKQVRGVNTINPSKLDSWQVCHTGQKRSVP